MKEFPKAEIVMGLKSKQFAKFIKDKSANENRSRAFYNESDYRNLRLSHWENCFLIYSSYHHFPLYQEQYRPSEYLLGYHLQPSSSDCIIDQDGGDHWTKELRQLLFLHH